MNCFQPTLEFRWYKYITAYTWSTKYDPIYNTTLQQKFINEETKEEKWVDIPSVIVEAPNCIYYG